MGRLQFLHDEIIVGRLSMGALAVLVALVCGGGGSTNLKRHSFQAPSISV
jgi:hypothetical protein